MQPINTHYLSLQIYFDFLEDNNHDTQELRLFTSTKHWHYVFIYNFSRVGGIYNKVGIDYESKVLVGGSTYGVVGVSNYVSEKAGSRFYPGDGVGG